VSRVCARIRPAEPADVDDLVALIASIDTSTGVFSGRPLEQDPLRIAERLHEMISSEERELLVAADDHSDAIVGLLAAKVEQIGAIDVVSALHVSHLMVTPKFRRRGVGRALLAAAVHLAEARGVDRVLATVSSGSREANRYLARIGFAPLVMQRLASTATLRRSLGIGDAHDRLALLRRARLLGAAAGRPATLAARVVRGA
jgi:ribosomal protein S18 acetylase RimI-like enzyme